MFDKLIDRHKNPINLLLHLIGSIIAVWGIWEHDWKLIGIAMVILILGHLFPCKK